MSPCYYCLLLILLPPPLHGSTDKQGNFDLYCPKGHFVVGVYNKYLVYTEPGIGAWGPGLLQFSFSCTDNSTGFGKESQSYGVPYRAPSTTGPSSYPPYYYSEPSSSFAAAPHPPPPKEYKQICNTPASGITPVLHSVQDGAYKNVNSVILSCCGAETRQSKQQQLGDYKLDKDIQYLRSKIVCDSKRYGVCGFRFTVEQIGGMMDGIKRIYPICCPAF